MPARDVSGWVVNLQVCAPSRTEYGIVTTVKDRRWLHPSQEPMALMGKGKSDLFLAQTGFRGTVVLTAATPRSSADVGPGEALVSHEEILGKKVKVRSSLGRE